MHCKETTPTWQGVTASLLLNLQSWNLVQCETLWGDQPEKHVMSQLSPCQGGEKVLLPHVPVPSRGKERYLAFWAPSAPMDLGADS